MEEMFGHKKDFKGLNAFFPKSGHKKQEAALFKKDTVSQKSTVVNATTVLSETEILEKLAGLLKPSFQVIYLNFYALTYKQNLATTGWLGYRHIAELCNVSLSTARRAVHTLTQKGLIVRTAVKNEKVKGSKYKVILPNDQKEQGGQNGHCGHIEHRGHNKQGAGQEQEKI